MSLAHPNLTRPPIQEALINLSVDFSSAPDPETFGDLDLAEKLTEVTPLRVFEAELESRPGEAVSAPMRPTVIGYRYADREGIHVAQLREDGVTFSVLRRYVSWGEMVEQATPVFEAYIEAADTVGQARVATRFINRVDVPPGADIRDYFRASLAIPGGVEAALSRFEVRSEFRDNRTGLDASVYLVSAGPLPDGGGLSVYLDVSASDSDPIGISPGQLLPDDLRDKLEPLRALKNRLFFGSLTAPLIHSYR
ncbi:MAG: TIGR04255 family protein [Bacteroidota bacterium]